MLIALAVHTPLLAKPPVLQANGIEAAEVEAAEVGCAGLTAISKGYVGSGDQRFQKRL